MAEAILKTRLEQAAIERNIIPCWTIDSAAIADWNVGYAPEDRCLEVLKENDISTTHLGRQICPDDFYTFDYIFGMDHSNMRDLQEKAPKDTKAKIEMLGKYDPQNEGIIRDPYFVRDVNNNCLKLNFKMALLKDGVAKISQSSRKLLRFHYFNCSNNDNHIFILGSWH